MRTSAVIQRGDPDCRAECGCGASATRRGYVSGCAVVASCESCDDAWMADGDEGLKRLPGWRDGIWLV